MYLKWLFECHISTVENQTRYRLEHSVNKRAVLFYLTGKANTFTEMFKPTFFLVMTIFCLTVLTDATSYRDCQDAKSETKEVIKAVEVSGCEKPPCKLRRGTKVAIHEVFVPKENIRQLKTSVKAVILGVPLPFVGVDNVDASKYVYTMDGQKADWPLIAGKEYHYNNTFPVEKFYPTVSPVVKWALVQGNEVITCFTVNARII